MKNRLYTNVGVTKDPNGNIKLRFTSDVVIQTKRYKRNGHTGVSFFTLPKPMTKLEAALLLVDKDGPLLNTDFTDAATRVINRFSHSA